MPLKIKAERVAIEKYSVIKHLHNQVTNSKIKRKHLISVSA